MALTCEGLDRFLIPKQHLTGFLIQQRHLTGLDRLDRFLIPKQHLTGLDRFLIQHQHLTGLDRSGRFALCGVPIEEHHAGDDTKWESLPDGETMGIPFCALRAQGLENVVVAGRCPSASHEAHASIGQCMAMGQAAGVAAALTKNGVLPELEIAKLCKRPLEMGGML
jgi:FAD dependent oxidoreductase